MIWPSNAPYRSCIGEVTEPGVPVQGTAAGEPRRRCGSPTGSRYGAWCVPSGVERILGGTEWLAPCLRVLEAEACTEPPEVAPWGEGNETLKDSLWAWLPTLLLVVAALMAIGSFAP